ncbi:MAG TPA: IS66 family transposase [Beijerinckiaceae bacterium]|nr:IS66 family transposase [Beijerinckiaceae bacterium]
MTLALADLPDDVETLKAMVLATADENAQLRAIKDDAEARIARLYAILKMLERARYGRRSERLDDDQTRFAFDEIETGLGAIEAELDRAAPKREREARPRKNFPAHLERVEIVIEPQALVCACGACERIKIGEDVSERLDVVPARFRVIVTRRPKYACKACREGVAQANAPARLIEAGLPSEGLLAHVAVSKYADGLPLYRQEGIYARDQVDLSRSTMAGWMGRVGFHLAPLAERVMDHIRAGERIFADETTLPTLAPGSGKAKTAWLWTYARDDRPFGRDGPPMVAYLFEESRGGACPDRHLMGFAGLLQVDGFSAYKRLAAHDRCGGPVTLASCWAHLRRRFYELHVAGVSRTATETVERMSALWAIEADIRGQSPDQRCAARQARSGPIVAALWNLWDSELPRIPGKSKLAEAIRYANSHRTALERFLHEGRLDIDNNAVERAIRPQTTGLSLCTSFSSVWKHWKWFRGVGATRAAFTGDRCLNVFGLQIA